MAPDVAEPTFAVDRCLPAPLNRDMHEPDRLGFAAATRKNNFRGMTADELRKRSAGFANPFFGVSSMGMMK